VELTGGLSPQLQVATYVIWAIFIADYAIKLLIAPDRPAYIRSSWLTALALLLPALRVVRALRVLSVLRAARVTRSISLVRLVTSANRGMGALASALGRRGLGYAFALTTLVTLLGAAGMAHFEREAATAAGGLRTYGDALWWTAMLMTTMGSDYWPLTPEGRILALLLAVYAFAIFGYITASIASILVARDRTEASAPPARDSRS
jgi:voltage-gated potassium channel